MHHTGRTFLEYTKDRSERSYRIFTNGSQADHKMLEVMILVKLHLSCESRALHKPSCV